MTRRNMTIAAIVVLLISVTLARFMTGRTQMPGPILNESASDAYTSNEIASFRTQMAGTPPEGLSTESAIEMRISSTVTLTEEDKAEIRAAVHSCLLHLTDPDWQRYKALKIRSGTVIRYGQVTSTFEQFWLKAGARGDFNEERLKRLWDFIYDNTARKPIPRIVRIGDNRVTIAVSEAPDRQPEKETFEAVRASYDGLTARALDDAVVATANQGSAPRRLAVVSGIMVTGFNDVPAPFAFAIEWRPAEKDWWPVSLTSAHPAFAPLF